MPIKFGNTSMKIGSQSAKISNPFNIVENMQITVEVENGQWFFSLNGFTESAKEVLNTGKHRIYLQLDRYNPVGQKRSFPVEISKGTTPPGQVDITEYLPYKFQRMNFTDWMNRILYALSCARYSKGISINQWGVDEGEKVSTGMIYMDISFTITIGIIGTLDKANSLVGKNLVPSSNFIRLNFYNNLSPIDVNYVMTDNTINIYSI